MKLGFSGHRNIDIDPKWFIFLKRKFPLLTTWVHGDARNYDKEYSDVIGLDQQVSMFLRDNKRELIEEKIKPDYTNHPAKTAPLTRNRHIVSMSSMMAIAWDGRKTGGTYYTLMYTIEVGKPVFLIPLPIRMTEKQKEISDNQLKLVL